MDKELNFILRNPFRCGLKFGLGFMVGWFSIQLFFEFINKVLDLIMFASAG